MGSIVTSALIEFRLLKRKCGWTCARRARSSDSRAEDGSSIECCSARRRGIDPEEDVVEAHGEKIDERARGQDARRPGLVGGFDPAAGRVASTSGRALSEVRRHHARQHRAPRCVTRSRVAEVS
jgi:hypothetical protein